MQARRGGVPIRLRMSKAPHLFSLFFLIYICVCVYISIRKVRMFLTNFSGDGRVVVTAIGIIANHAAAGPTSLRFAAVLNRVRVIEEHYGASREQI